MLAVRAGKYLAGGELTLFDRLPAARARLTTAIVHLAALIEATCQGIALKKRLHVTAESNRFCKHGLHRMIQSFLFLERKCRDRPGRQDGGMEADFVRIAVADAREPMLID